MIACPKCGAESSVVETRRTTPNQARRRRHCDNVECRYRFTTVEIVTDMNGTKNRIGDVVVVPRRFMETIANICALALGEKPQRQEDKHGHEDEEEREGVRAHERDQLGGPGMDGVDGTQGRDA